MDGRFMLNVTVGPGMDRPRSPDRGHFPPFVGYPQPLNRHEPAVSGKFYITTIPTCALLHCFRRSLDLRQCIDR